MHLQLSVEERSVLLRRARLLEILTLGWNVVGVVVLASLAVASASVALAGFALVSVIAIAASTVVLWGLSDTGDDRTERTVGLIGKAFTALAGLLVVASTIALIAPHHPEPSPGGIAWAGVTALVMFQLAAGKRNTGHALQNSALMAESRVSVINGLLAGAVLVGLSCSLLMHWWFMDPILGFVIAYYAAREAILIFRP
jgi:divalent metal cation (Fe/Co/Zn/Cd) transporter